MRDMRSRHTASSSSLMVLPSRELRPAAALHRERAERRPDRVQVGQLRRRRVPHRVEPHQVVPHRQVQAHRVVPHALAVAGEVRVARAARAAAT